jgi:hypothetical protein
VSVHENNGENVAIEAKFPVLIKSTVKGFIKTKFKGDKKIKT